MARSSNRSPTALRRLLLFGGLLALLAFTWIAFFDSHSLLKRYRWHQQYEAVSAENQSLREQIQALDKKLDEPLSDETVERIAREEYGMKRPGETIYRIREQE